jgi:putative ABC transport system substrate-binding protein
VISRRAFLGMTAGGLLAAPLAAEAQQRAKVPTIGFLVPSTGPYIGAPTVVYDVFRQGLRDLGYVEGQNIRLEYRSSSDRAQLTDLAAELERYLPVRGLPVRIRQDEGASGLYTRDGVPPGAA